MADNAVIKPVTIVADSRETRSGIATKLARIPGVTVEQAELSSGDFLIGGGFAVERKAATDFIVSIMEGRLFDQMARMAIEHEQVVVLVEEISTTPARRLRLKRSMALSPISACSQAPL